MIYVNPLPKRLIFLKNLNLFFDKIKLLTLFLFNTLTSELIFFLAFLVFSNIFFLYLILLFFLVSSNLSSDPNIFFIFFINSFITLISSFSQR